MNAAPTWRDAEALGEAVIVGAEISAGHDGEAELILRLRYENGAFGLVTLDAEAAFDLMNDCGVSRADDLAGQSWRKILGAP